MSDLRSGVVASVPAPSHWQLPYEPPYDWSSLVLFLSLRAIAGVELVDASRYARTFRVGTAGAGIFEVRPGAGDALEASVWYAGPEADLPEIVRRIRRICGIDEVENRAAMRHRFSLDPVLGPLIERRPGLRIPGAWDPFELSIRAIVGQQITVKAATSIAGRLARTAGPPLPWAAGVREDVARLSLIFPTAAELASCDFTDVGMPLARWNALAKFITRMAGEPDFFSPEETVARRLTALPGIGDWTAQYIAMRAMRDPDAFPAADVVLRRVFGDGSPAGRTSMSALQKRAEAWRPWRAFAAMHVWIAESVAAGEREAGRAAARAAAGGA